MTELRGASNTRARQELGWQPRYPSWSDGFAAELGPGELPTNCHERNRFGGHGPRRPGRGPGPGRRHASADPRGGAGSEAGSGDGRLGGLVEELVSTLTGHLKHEENEALPLIDATMTGAQWQHFTEAHRNGIGADVPRYFPWLLDGASETSAEALLSLLPPDVRDIYNTRWQPAYTKLDLW